MNLGLAAPCTRNHGERYHLTGMRARLNPMVRLLALCAAFCAGLGGADARTLAEVASSKLLRVVVYEDNAPFSFRRDGALAGIDVEIARLLAKSLDAELELMPQRALDDIGADLAANLKQREGETAPPGDVMMHVPVDREVAARNPEVLIGQQYFEERIALAYDPARLGQAPNFEMFRKVPIAVESGTLADYFLTFAYEGALRPNIVHCNGIPDGVKLLARRDVAGLLGVKSRVEAAAGEAKVSAAFAELALPGIAAPRWSVGLAVTENARDLSEFLGQALATLKASGALDAISAEFGVSYAAPGAAGAR